MNDDEQFDKDFSYKKIGLFVGFLGIGITILYASILGVF